MTTDNKKPYIALLRGVATTRNFNTLSKLIAMVDEIEQNS